MGHRTVKKSEQKERDMQESRSWGNALLYVALFLTALGIVAIYTSSALKALTLVNDPLFFVRKQILAASLGIFAIGLMTYMPTGYLKSLPLPLTVLTILLLSFILIPGAMHKVGGASRWIRWGGFGFQPSELAKISLVFFVAKSLSRPSDQPIGLRSYIVPNMTLLLILVGLLMLQPDLGTSILLTLVCASMLIIGGMPWKVLGYLGGVAFFFLIAAIIHAPYRWNRLIAFLNPWENIQTSGFQIIQSYLAFQNGGLLGTGLGQSRQKLFFLPEAHTDFILAVIAEELGVIGVLFVCIAFGYITWLGLKITRAQSQPYFCFLAFGLTCLIGFQSVINIGVAMGALPTKGIPLPFISSGPTALVTFLIIVGILVRLSRESEKPHVPR